jgi:hypothetical protein
MWDNILSETVVVREELNMVEWAGAVLGGLKALPGVMTIAGGASVCSHGRVGHNGGALNQRSASTILIRSAFAPRYISG